MALAIRVGAAANICMYVEATDDMTVLMLPLGA